MNQSPRDKKPETELQQQFRQLVFEAKHLIDVLINCFYSLTREGAQRRAMALMGLFVFITLFFGLFSRDYTDWATLIGNSLLYLLNPTLASSFPENPIQKFFQVLLEVYISANGFHYLFLIVLPFFVAWRLAAIYLADIFELEKISTASNFIMQTALTGGNTKIHIRDGDIAPEDEHSPAYLIGGPGIAIVELDSAALFEQPDGRPYVVGPTVEKPFVLDGFERFRQAIILRDHRTDPLEVSSRSLDGISVQAVGVSYLFSVDRGENATSTAERPYPFRGSNTIESLVYGLAARVTPDGPRPADVSRAWFGTMMTLIRGALANFMSEHNLTEYLASYGIPEVQLDQRQTDAVLLAARRVLPPGRQIPILPLGDIPDFVSRPTIKTTLFSEFPNEFPALASQRGVVLHWVGIGSWKTPSEIIPEQHLEAWQLSMDNQMRQNTSMPNLRAQHITGFIQDVPLERFEQSRQKQLSHREIMTSLLIGYREQFMKILHLMEKKREMFNNGTVTTIIVALRHINRILGYPEDFEAHWVAGGDIPPRPNDGAEQEDHRHHDYTPEEQRLFAQLVQKANNIDAAERLLEFERGLDPNASETELILRAIQRLE
jgi:hypothetical protein